MGARALGLFWRLATQSQPCLPAGAPPARPTPPRAAAELCSGVPVYKGKDETVLDREMHYSAQAERPPASLEGSLSSPCLGDESPEGGELGALCGLSFPSPSPPPWLFVSLVVPLFPQPHLPSVSLSSWWTLAHSSLPCSPTVPLISGSFSSPIIICQTLPLTLSFPLSVSPLLLSSLLPPPSSLQEALSDPQAHLCPCSFPAEPCL